MTIRYWVIGKVREELPYGVELDGEHGFVVTRETLPPARVYCPEPSDSDPFAVDDLLRAREEMPGLQFVVAIRRRIANDTYTCADEIRVAIGGLGALKSALENDSDIGLHRTREQKYVQRRLGQNQHVESLRRRGESTYEITRKAPLSTLRIVTLERYELTSDDVYELLETHPELDVDAIVITNPNCQSFAREALAAAANARTRIMTLRDFLPRLGSSWS